MVGYIYGYNVYEYCGEWVVGLIMVGKWYGEF